MLERIRIEGYKSIRTLDLTLRPLNVLIGANGAGKSNLISLFQLLNEVMARRFQVYTGRVGADTLLHFGEKITPRIEVELVFRGEQSNLHNIYEAVWEPTQRDTLIFADERYGIHDQTRYADPRLYSAGQGHPETQLYDRLSNTPHRGVADYVVEALESWKVYHFHDTSAEAGVKKLGDIADNEILRADAGNLAAFLNLLHETERGQYDRIVNTVRLVAPFFEDFNLRPSPLNTEKIRLEWREYGSDAYFSAHMLSDGTLRFMCLATLLLQPRLPSLILIDEPELGLHPYAITLLAELLESAAQRTQVIVSTQSVPLINQLTPEDIVVVDREGGQSTFTRLDSASLEGWLEAYSLGELWEKNIFGGRPQRAGYPG
jgi:predicted ATPase